MISKVHPRRLPIAFASLDDEILNIIFSYLNPFKDLLSLAGCCRALRLCVYESRMWHSVPVDICVVERCFGCGRVRRSLAGALTICERCPLHFIRLHLQLSDLQPYLPALLRRGSVRQLHLRFDANKSENEEYRYDASVPNHGKITSLTMYGWPKQANNCDGILRQLGLGLRTFKCMESSPSSLFPSLAEHCPQLQSLVLENTDLSYAPGSLAAYHSDTLRELTLNQVQGVPISTPWSLPNLLRLELLPIRSALPHNPVDSSRYIQCLPTNIKELLIAVLRSQLNTTLTIIGQRCVQLQTLVVQVVEDQHVVTPAPIPTVPIPAAATSTAVIANNLLTQTAYNGAMTMNNIISNSNGNNEHNFQSNTSNSLPAPPLPHSNIHDYMMNTTTNHNDTAVMPQPVTVLPAVVEEDGIGGGEDDDSSSNLSIQVEEHAITSIMQGCPQLRYLEISGYDVSWSINAFRALTQAQFLRKVKLFASDDILQELPQLLAHVETLQEIVFFENATLLADMHEWHLLEETLAKISERFPAIILRLEDHWWEPFPLP